MDVENKPDARYLAPVPWLLSMLVAALALLVWAQGLGWQFSGLSAEAIFPVLGILAFSLMWVHYAVDFLERFFSFESWAGYLPVTRYVVLFALIMHTGLLAWAAWRGGFGLPPESFLNYVGADYQIWVIMGIVAWLAFMAFELHHWYRNRPWFRWVGYATDAAMIAIFFHALQLGGDVHTGWFHWVWYFYGASLVIFLIKAYVDVYRSRA